MMVLIRRSFTASHTMQTHFLKSLGVLKAVAVGDADVPAPLVASPALAVLPELKHRVSAVGGAVARGSALFKNIF